MTDCIFCKIIEGNIPTKKLIETDMSLAFLDAFPLAKGHSLVIPKKHHSKLQYMSPEENSDLFLTVHKLVSRVDSITGSTLIAIHNGKEAGQEIPHLHVHLVPRSPKDSAGPIHSMFDEAKKFPEHEIDDIFNKLKD